EAGERRADDYDARSAHPIRSAFDGDGLLGAAASRLLHLVPQLLAGLLLQDVEEVVVPHLEHLGGGGHAQGIALAEVEIDNDAHVALLRGVGIPAGEPSLPGSWGRPPTR